MVIQRAVGLDGHVQKRPDFGNAVGEGVLRGLRHVHGEEGHARGLHTRLAAPPGDLPENGDNTVVGGGQEEALRLQAAAPGHERLRVGEHDLLRAVVGGEVKRPGGGVEVGRVGAVGDAVLVDGVLAVELEDEADGDLAAGELRQPAAREGVGEKVGGRVGPDEAGGGAGVDGARRHLGLADQAQHAAEEVARRAVACERGSVSCIVS